MKLNLFDYQRKIVEMDDDAFVCNWARGLSKTYTLASIVVEKRPKNVLFCDQSQNGFKTLKKKLDEIFTDYGNNDIWKFSYSKEKIEIKYNNEEVTNIYNYHEWGTIPKDDSFDYIMFDNILPIDLSFYSKQIISMVTMNNYDRKLEDMYDSSIYVDNLDYKIGLRYGLYDKHKLEEVEKKSPEIWFEQYAILDNSSQNIFNNEILDVLNEEIKSLNFKIKKARESENWGTYKNLILAYKEVLMLLERQEEKISNG